MGLCQPVPKKKKRTFQAEIQHVTFLEKYAEFIYISMKFRY